MEVVWLGEMRRRLRLLAEEAEVGDVWSEEEGKAGSFPVRLAEQRAAVPPSWQGGASEGEEWEESERGWVEVEKAWYRE